MQGRGCGLADEIGNVAHVEPIVMRTYIGRAERLVSATSAIYANKEVVVPCLEDGPPADLLARKTKVQRLKASLKLLDYNAKAERMGWLPSAPQFDANPIEWGNRLADTIPGSRLVRLPGTGRLVPEEAPETLTNMILEFVGASGMVSRPE